MRSLRLAALALACAGCDKTNTVDATNIDCGEEAIKCVPCEAETLDCDGETLIRCKPDGRGFVVAEACASAPLCAEGLAEGRCAEPVCQSDEARCVDAIMQVCAPGRHRWDLVPCGSPDACLRGLAEGRCAETECSEANDCAGEDTQCRRRVCVEGRCGIEHEPAATPCVIREVNGACDGAGACVPTQEAACTIAADCPGEDTACLIRACAGGSCSMAPTPDGTPCTADGLRGACDGEGQCLTTSECNGPRDCPGEDTQCRIRACVVGVCDFAPLPMGTACDVDGIPGACDGAGQCARAADCGVPADCPGVDGECRVRACSDEGLCGFADLPADTPCDAGGFAGLCDGAGGCRQTQNCRNDGDCGGRADACQRPVCRAGQCRTDFNNGDPCALGASVGVCSGGTCECPQDTPQLCGNECVRTADDERHCGRCNSPCGANETCSGSSCDCNEGFGECGRQCIDWRVDGNCGGCGNVCAENAVCVPGSNCFGSPVRGGACECAPGFERCSTAGIGGPNPHLDGACLDPASEDFVANCRAAATRCARTRD